MIAPLKGMPDLLPSDSALRLWAEKQMREVVRRYGCLEIRTPMLEASALFQKSVGDTTDIVEKEMYTMVDKSGDSITLRPEGTASVVRAFISNHLHTQGGVSRLYYLGEMFRHERPQKGRLRQFSQLGVEVLNSDQPLMDVEVMGMLHDVVHIFKPTQAKLSLNSVGDASCRPDYREKLVGYFNSHRLDLCETCQRRLQTNPMCILDCKNPTCQALAHDAPKSIDHLCLACQQHHEAVVAGLTALGISFEINPYIVRGLDYYTRTAFEMTAGGLGSQNAVGGGGRYDGLVAAMGGPQTPAVGFAVGVERLLLGMTTQPDLSQRRCMVLSVGTMAQVHALRIADELRRVGLPNMVIIANLESSSLKSKLRQAQDFDYALILGEDEVKAQTVVVKHLVAHRQEVVAWDQINAYLKKENVC